MKVIKEITKGDYKLTHSTYIDSMGFERNSFEVTRTEFSGHRMSKPFYAPLRVTEMTGGDDYGSDDVRPYTDKEYEKMLEDNRFR